EAVRLVTDPLQQIQTLGAARQDDGVGLTRQPYLFQPLGQADQRYVVDTEVVEHRLRRGDLRSTAVDHHQIRRVGELTRPAGLWVDPTPARGLRVRRRGVQRADGHLRIEIP